MLTLLSFPSVAAHVLSHTIIFIAMQFGMTVLMLALQEGTHMEVVELLLDKGADIAAEDLVLSLMQVDAM
jgi:hypothetical protein